MKILGISLGHDSNFTLLQDGIVKEVFEAERYFRSKRYKLEALKKNEKKISGFQEVNNLDLIEILNYIKNNWGSQYNGIALQNQKRIEEELILKEILSSLDFSFDIFENFNHHLCHASSSYFTSPYQESLILSYDGQGNDGYTIFFKAKGNRIEYLKKYNLRMGGNYNNLGFMIGLKPDVSGSTAGKLMGLTSYGTHQKNWRKYIQKYIEKYKKISPYIPKNFINSYGKLHIINSIGINKIKELKNFKYKKSFLDFKKNIKGFVNYLFNSQIKIGSEKNTLSHNLAKTFQDLWSEKVIKLINSHKNESKCISVVGGCALNGITNYQLERSNLFEKVHYIPNPTDCGLSVGASYLMYYKLTNNKKKDFDYFSPYLGSKPFDIVKMEFFKKEYPNKIYEDESELKKIIAKLINQNFLLGVIRGNYELGPRALGNRSILCNPMNKNMREILNNKVKKREWYRPFAPVCTAEDAKKYFTNLNDIPYMSVICYTKEKYKNLLPSITHVDGSCRLQTINKYQNNFLWSLLKEFEKLSKFPILLNTSFNPGGEPILNYCEVGLQMLKDTDLDFVLIENTLFSKNKDKLKALD